MRDLCEKCGLYKNCKTPFMPGFGTATPRVLIIGEAPGANEDDAGRPFIGRSGELLADVIDLLEISTDDIRMTNTIRCRPPENKTPTARQVSYCAELLQQEIEQTQPEIIVLLGNSPLKAVLGVSGITNYNGQVIQRDDYTYIPAYHPAYILRNGGNEELLKEWLDGLENIPKILNGKSVKRADHYFEYKFPKTIEDLEQMCEEIFHYAQTTDGLVAYDVETVNKDFLDPNNCILSAALAIDGTAWSFPLYHADSHWSDDELGELEDILMEILTHPAVRVITHTKYDVKATRALLDFDFRQYGDTIHLSRLLNAHHREHGLKRLAGLHLNMFDYDKELDDYKASHKDADYAHGGSYANVPLEILLPYGGMDVAATILLHKALYPLLTVKQQKFYEQLVIPGDYMLSVMEDNGFKMDKKLIKHTEHVYRFVQDKFYEQLLLDPDIAKYVNGKDDKFVFNPNSTIQLSEILYGLKKFPVYGKTDKGLPSCKRDYLLEMRYDFLESDADFSEEIKFLNTYLDWKLISTIRSKTFNPMMSETSDWYNRDGRSRSDYLLGGAKTGRITSRNPNLQNIPSVESEPGTILQYRPVKNAFTHTWDDGCLLMADYSGMELRVISSVAGIQGMIDVFSRGGDVHRYVSSLIYKKPESEITKFERYRGKWCNWSLLYKGSWNTLYRLYRINGLTIDEAKHITDLYYKAFPELLQYHERTIKFLLANGFVESPFGRRLYLPEMNDNREGVRNKAFRTAVNMPIQGTAADTLIAATTVIYHYMQQENMKSLLVNTVHDSLVADVYPGELKAVQDLQKDVLENMPSYAKTFMPDVDFSWLKVPLKADFEVGSHYGCYGQPAEWKCEYCGSTQLQVLSEHVTAAGHNLEMLCQHCIRKQQRVYDSSSTAERMRYNNCYEFNLPIGNAKARKARRMI